MRLRFVIADKVERHRLRGIVSHAGEKSCELCIACAKTGPISWPYKESKGFRERTVAEMLEASRYCVTTRLVSCLVPA